MDGTLGSMTVAELRNWLTVEGFEEDVFRLQSRTPPPRKADWLQLARDRAAERGM